jgi:phosphoribosyl 1,2-cyclic phosphodiesterase
MQVDALASGSSGNAYLVRCGSTAVLVEAGLPAARLATFLIHLNFDPRCLNGILLTHAHADHRRGAREFSDRYEVPIYATRGTLGHRTLRDSPLAQPLRVNRPLELGQLELTPFRVPHDCIEPVGFRVSGGGAVVCLTTDLGFVPDSVQPFLEGADLLVLEANHDEQMLWTGPYPWFLKRRVGGDSGHLSNWAAARCLARLQRRPPRQVWLAHLSLVNNRPTRALDIVNGTLARAGLGHVAVAAAARNRPSLGWCSERRPEQLVMF